MIKMDYFELNNALKFNKITLETHDFVLFLLVYA